MRPLKTVVLVLMLALLLAAAATGCGQGPAEPQPPPPSPPPDNGAAVLPPDGMAGIPGVQRPPLDWPAVGQPAPAFTLGALDGAAVTVPADFSGRAVILLFFSLG